MPATNNLLTSQVITYETLRIIENNIVLPKLVNRGYDDQFAKKGAKVGNSVNVRKPPQWTIRSGQAVNIQGAQDTQVPLSITEQDGVDFEFSSSELTLSVDDFSGRYLKSAAAAIANIIDFKLSLFMYLNTFNFVGSPGTVPTTALTYLQALQKLQEMSVPMDSDLSMVVTPAMNVNAVDNFKGFFNAQAPVGEQYKSGLMKTAWGFDWAMSQNIRTHTVGALGGTPLVNGVGQSGSSLVIDGCTATTGALKRGDIISIGGGSGTTQVNAVNIQNRASTGAAYLACVAADCTADGSGNLTIPLTQAIVGPGSAFQNVDALPTDNATIQTFGAVSTFNSKQSPQGLAFHKDAFCLVSADLEVPGGVDMGYRAVSKKTGLSLRFIRQYVATTDQWVCRFDVIYGFGAFYPQWCCRIAS